MNEETNKENEIYSYTTKEGVRVYTPNVEFADIMALKYGTDNVYVEKF